MSVSLSGYLVKGPAKITPEMKHAALKLLAACQREIEQALAVDDEGEALARLQDPGLYDRNLFPDDFHEMVCLDGHTFVREFMGFWKNGAGDAHSRIDPDQDEAVILFAGGESHGDEPEGEGYTLLRDLHRFPGLPECFHIR